MEPTEQAELLERHGAGSSGAESTGLTRRSDVRRAWLGEDESALTAPRIAKHRLAEQVRRLIDATCQLDVGDSGYGGDGQDGTGRDDGNGDSAERWDATDPAHAEYLEALAREAADLAERIAALPRIPRATVEDRNSSQARRMDSLLVERSTINGRSNPLAPPVRMYADGDVIRAEAYFTAPYEGPPGRVHGAWVAACFDEILGCAQGASGAFGFTGTLTIRMRAATPLYTKIAYEAGLEKRDGRKLLCWGRCYANGVLTAEASGIFIVPQWAAQAGRADAPPTDAPS